MLTLSFKALLMTSSRLQNLMNICETLIEFLGKLTGNYKILKLTLDQKKNTSRSSNNKELKLSLKPLEDQLTPPKKVKQKVLDRKPVP